MRLPKGQEASAALVQIVPSWHAAAHTAEAAAFNPDPKIIAESNAP
jgi:hypothetical protein